MNDSFPYRISHHEACAIIDREAAARRMAPERVGLARAHGRIVAARISAQLPQPPFDNAAMDGFAFRHADVNASDFPQLRLVGEQFADVALKLEPGPGECVRITTGAPLPRGADTVVIKEHTRLDGDNVLLEHCPRAGQNVRRMGEDSAIGDVLLKPGDVLTPARIALAASQGLAELTVSTLPTVAVFASGDELVEPGLALRPGQIYNSNREQLMGLLLAEGVQPVAWPTLPDRAEDVAAMLRDAAQAFDLIITCGGVSVGEKDHFPNVLREAGEILFWKVTIKPGMPVLFARGGSLGPALVLCLPGNPVSVLATFLAYARRVLDGMQGRAPRPRWHARLAAPWSKRNARLEFLRGRLAADETGVLQVFPNPADGSHRMRAAADSDALIVLDEGEHDWPQGAVVEVIPY